MKFVRHPGRPLSLFVSLVLAAVPICSLAYVCVHWGSCLCCLVSCALLGKTNPGWKPCQAKQLTTALHATATQELVAKIALQHEALRPSAPWVFAPPAFALSGGVWSCVPACTWLRVLWLLISSLSAGRGCSCPGCSPCLLALVLFFFIGFLVGFLGITPKQGRLVRLLLCSC